MISEKELKQIEETLDNSSGSSWYSIENEEMYQIFSHFSEGMLDLQILKAPKKSYEFAEYWPLEWDDKLITNAKDWLKMLLDENKELKKELEKKQ